MQRTTVGHILGVWVAIGLVLSIATCGGDADTSPVAPSSTNTTPASPQIEPGTRLVVDIVSSRGATLPVVIIAPSVPSMAAVILLEGDDGTITLGGTSEDPQIQSEGFLARNADAFAAQGLLVALVGVPSDNATGIDLSYRISTEQSDDIAAVVAWIDARASLSVWVLGMSLGSYSASQAHS